MRALSDREVHAIGFRLQHQFAEEGLSGPQEWLFDAVVSELAYRRRHSTWPDHRCSCELCWGPFDEEPF